MKLCDKIIELRKMNGMSQEALAEKLNISRQTVSRWEMNTVLPDANNILQLSKLFNVSADYLLNDDYQSDDDLPKVKKVKDENLNQIMFYLIVIEIMILLIQFMTTFILQNVFFAFLSFLPFVAAIAGFEYSFRKNQSNEHTIKFRKKFYKISAWLGLYFPIRFVITVLMRFYPRPYSSLILEIIILCVYICISLIVDLNIEKNNILNKY